tara:strand:- start:854 stop:1540 length:687 start_codon:yes stop_codon:yes gene_type:complete
MTNKKDIFCIIPARKGSKRLKNKNILPYKKKPIICHSIEAAIGSNIFSEILVTSDSPKVKKICKKYKKVTFLSRKSSLSNSKASVSDVCIDILNNQKFEKFIKYFCVLYPTSPLRDSNDIKKCYRNLKSKKTDSIIAVTKYYYPPFQALIKKRKLLKPAFRKLVNLKSDRFENKIFVDSGSMYMVKIKEFKKLKTFYTNKIGGYFMSQNKSIDIDYISDYQRLIKNTL